MQQPCANVSLWMGFLPQGFQVPSSAPGLSWPLGASHAPCRITEVSTSLWTTGDWFTQLHTGNHHLCMGWYSKVANINHREPQALINPDTQTILKPKGCFASFPNNSFDGKTWPEVMWGYLLSLFFPLNVNSHTFCCRNINRFDYGALPLNCTGGIT
jgi:hypothetical protein